MSVEGEGGWAEGEGVWNESLLTKSKKVRQIHALASCFISLKLIFYADIILNNFKMQWAEASPARLYIFYIHGTNHVVTNCSNTVNIQTVLVNLVANKCRNCTYIDFMLFFTCSQFGDILTMN